MVKAIAEESAGMNPHVKEGVYVGRLAGVTERTIKTTDKDANGKPVPGTEKEVPRWEWTFGVRTPEGDIRMTALTSPKITTKSKAFSFVKGVNGGKAPQLGVEFDTDVITGAYGNLGIKDKARKDLTGNIQMTSEITEIFPLDKAPSPDIKIDGLIVEEEEDVENVPAAPPTPPSVPAAPATEAPKKKKK